jgi:predicted transposase YdaD
MIESVAYDILREDALREGLREGLQEGLQKGLREGFEKGIQKSIRKMFLKGFKPQEIADVLDVDIQEVLAVIQFDSDEKP